MLDTFIWQLRARDSLSQVQDNLSMKQRVTAAVPVTVQQATLLQLEGPHSLEIKAPSAALAQRGGMKLSFSRSLAQGLPSVQAWLASYPFSCLEQSASKALGMRDHTLWSDLLTQLPGYLDSDGLATYFPTRAGDRNRGSDTLTAYLLSAAHEASTLDSNFDPSANAPINAIAPYANGTILVGGDFTTFQPNNAAFRTSRTRLAILNSDGVLNPGFNPGPNGPVYAVLANSDGSALAAGSFSGLQADGSVLVGGAFATIGGSSLANLALVDGDGNASPSFTPKVGSSTTGSGGCSNVSYSRTMLEP
jgi:hypothetical protein